MLCLLPLHLATRLNRFGGRPRNPPSPPTSGPSAAGVLNKRTVAADAMLHPRVPQLPTRMGILASRPRSLASRPSQRRHQPSTTPPSHSQILAPPLAMIATSTRPPPPTRKALATGNVVDKTTRGSRSAGVGGAAQGPGHRRVHLRLRQRHNGGQPQKSTLLVSLVLFVCPD